MKAYLKQNKILIYRKYVGYNLMWYLVVVIGPCG